LLNLSQAALKSSRFKVQSSRFGGMDIMNYSYFTGGAKAQE
jgi:hypothetical protein